MSIHLIKDETCRLLIDVVSSWKLYRRAGKLLILVYHSSLSVELLSVQDATTSIIMTVTMTVTMTETDYLNKKTTRRLLDGISSINLIS